MTLISELLDLPDVVNRGDLVLRLSEGITDEQAQATLQHYVGTDSFRKNFDDALRFIKGAVDSRSSKGSYLHGQLRQRQEERKFLLVPYHMIGARSMESAILERRQWSAHCGETDPCAPGVRTSGHDGFDLVLSDWAQATRQRALYCRTPSGG